MKRVYYILGAGLVSLLTGCASTPVALVPVGPNPAGIGSMASNGQLQVFSSLAGRSEGDNPTWYQHTDYYIYSMQGKLMEHVDNTTGYYASTPPAIALAAGNYLVKAQAEDYLWVDVPVVIERGRTTRVHMDDNWKPPAATPKRELVSMPNGNPVGWRAESTKALGMN
jgi:hypothetical protein